MSTTTIGTRVPHTSQKKFLASAVATLALVGGLAIVQAQPAHAVAIAGGVAIYTPEVESDGTLWFALGGFTDTPNTAHTVTLVRSGVSYGSTTVTTDASGATELRDSWIRVSPSAPVATDYQLVVTNPLTPGTDDVTSATITVAGPSLIKVTNPGDHAGGNESIVVQQSGVWTFNAEGFAANGKLRATAVIGGSNTYFGGVGQSADSAGPYWPLDSNGDSTPLTRVKLANPSTGAVPAIGELEVTFTDGTISVVRTLVVDAAPAATVTIVGTDDIDNTITISGTGWTHPTDPTGSVIAIKVDDGAYSRLVGDEAEHPQTHNPITNRTVWYAFQAASDGTFTQTITMPTGSTSGTDGSSPAFPAGSHWLRLLSGSLHTVPTDTSRTVASVTFTWPF